MYRAIIQWAQLHCTELLKLASICNKKKAKNKKWISFSPHLLVGEFNFTTACMHSYSKFQSNLNELWTNTLVFFLLLQQWPMAKMFAYQFVFLFFILQLNQIYRMIVVNFMAVPVYLCSVHIFHWSFWKMFAIESIARLHMRLCCDIEFRLYQMHQFQIQKYLIVKHFEWFK